MPARLVILGALVVLAAAAAWYFLGGGGGGDEPPGSGNAATPMAAAGPADTPAPPEPGVAIEASRFRPEPEVPAPADGGEETVGPGVPFVQVQDGGGRPVPGASLEIRLGEDFSWFMGADPGDEEAPPWRSLRSNRDGRAPLRPAPPGTFRLTGAKDGLTGAIRAEPAELDPAKPLVLVLKAARPVEVKVVDPAGQPVPFVRVRAAPNAATRDVHVTGADGRVRFHVSPLDGEAFENATFQPVADLPSSTVRAEAAVPWAESGPTEASIAVPRGVTVRVEIRNARPGRHEVVWGPRAERSRRERGMGVVMLSGGSGGGGVRSGRRVFTTPEVSVAGFPPGETVTFRIAAHGCVPVRRKVQLPPAEGLFDLVVDAGPDFARLELRIQEPGGRAPVGEKFILDVDQPEPEAAPAGAPQHDMVFLVAGGGPDRAAVPGPDGVFRLDVDPWVAGTLRVKRARPGSAGLALGIGHGAPPGEGDWLAELPFPPLEPGATHRFEPLALEAEPALVSGRVVDAAGRPVNQASVRCLPGSAARTEDWHRFDGSAGALRATTGPDGRFAVRGANPGFPLAAEAELPGAALSPRRDFAAGDQDVELKLASAGSLEGRLLKARPELGGIRVTLHPAEAGTAAELWWYRQARGFDRDADAEGRFRFPGLAAGTYEARVTIAGHRVLTVSGVVVPAGEICRDPRLDGVVVGQEFEDAWVSARRPDGSPVAGARVELGPAAGADADGDQGGHASGRTDDAGRAAFLLPRGVRRSVNVSAEGFVPWSRSSEALPVEAVLDPGCTLTVRLQGTGPLPVSDEIPGWEVTASPAVSGGTAAFASSALLIDSGELVVSSGSTRGGPGGRVGTDRAAVVRCVPPGKHTLTLVPRKKPRRGATGSGAFMLVRDGSVTGDGIPLGDVEIAAGVHEKSASFPLDEVKVRDLLTPPEGR